MSDAIGFLDTMGRGAFAADPGGAYAEAVDALEIDDGQRAALRARDAAALGRLLQARAATTCLIMTPDGGEPLDAPDDDDRGQDDDDRDDDAPRPQPD
ncbi:hypothetical protein LDO32_00780 [Luteimonas sp. Y-2-2-4F]|nr:hypothetical protein [Luteimonas sp. Y-2-2-4F]MCD9030270.1 hypothetical protein [Luteimonas sp. Y-2-2-4F]